MSEDEYRALAARAEAWLTDPRARSDAPDTVPPLVARAASARALVVDPGKKAVGLFPLEGGRVADGAAVTVAPDAIDAAIVALRWDAPAEGADDWPWLVAWLRSPKARALFVPVSPHEAAASLAARVRAVLPPRFGGNVGRSRGQG